MRRSSYIDQIHQIIGVHCIEVDEQILSELFKVIFEYSLSVLDIFKKIFNNLNLIFQTSYSISSKHQQIAKVIKDLMEKLVVNENFVCRSITNIIAVKCKQHRDVSKAISSELLELAQNQISSRIIGYVEDKKSEKLLINIKKDFVRSENHLLFLIASQY